MIRNETAERRQNVGIGELWVVAGFVNRLTTVKYRGLLKELQPSARKCCFEDVTVAFHCRLFEPMLV